MSQRRLAVIDLTGARRRNTAAITAMTSRSRGANRATGKMKVTKNVADRTLQYRIPADHAAGIPYGAPFVPLKRTVTDTPAPRIQSAASAIPAAVGRDLS